MKRLLPLLFCCAAFAQSPAMLSVIPVWGARPIALGDTCIASAGQEVVFETIRFYLGHLAVAADGKRVWTDDTPYHLMDAERPETMHIALPRLPQTIDSLRFTLGTDSLTNVSGALGGDLDPTLGMYWAWNSGYINAKIEGSSPACPARKHQFQYHIGGYLPPYQTVQSISLPVRREGEALVVYLDLQRFMAGVDLQTEHSIMIPGAASVRMARLLAQSFSCDAE